MAHEALAGHLVLFVGAGIGIGAGLPSWSGLLDQLAARADLSDLELRELHDMDNRDAGALLEQRLGRTALTESIAEIVGGSKVSLFHQLLAALPTTEALTTNYDALLERAFADAGRPATVLPRARSARGRWLLKLHGSVDDQRRMVLSRGDYLRFEGREAALAGIVWMALRSRRHPVVSGREQMIGAVGRVVADFDREGFVHVHGEQWQAVTDTPLTHGQRVAVTGMQGLVLRVRPATPSEETLS